MKTIVDLVEEQKEYLLEKDTAAKQAVEANIAPVEADASSASRAYVVGEQLFLNDVLYDVTSPISVGDSIAVGTNITAANKLSADIQSKQDQIEVTTMPTASASNVGKVLIYIGATTSTYTSGQSYQSTLEGGNYIWKPTSISSVDASDVVYDNQTSGLTATDSQAAIDELASQNQTLTNQVKDAYEVMGQNGAKNLLPIKYSKITSYGLTWEKLNDDSVSINGTSTASPAQQSLFDVTPVVVSSNSGTIISLKDLGIDGTKTYVFSRDAKITNVRPRIDLWSDSAKLLEIELSNNDGLYKEIDFSQYPTCTGIKATIQVNLNTTVTNAIQKIMLCPKELYDVDPTYKPYAKTNKELTDNNTTLNKLSEITNITSKLTGTGISLLKYGNVVTFNIYIGDVTDITAWTEALMTLPSDCKPPKDVYIHDINSTEKVILIRASTGDVNVNASSTTIHAGSFIATYVVN